MIVPTSVRSTSPRSAGRGSTDTSSPPSSIGRWSPFRRSTRPVLRRPPLPAPFCRPTGSTATSPPEPVLDRAQHPRGSTCGRTDCGPARFGWSKQALDDTICSSPSRRSSLCRRTVVDHRRPPCSAPTLVPSVALGVVVPVIAAPILRRRLLATGARRCRLGCRRPCSRRRCSRLWSASSAFRAAKSRRTDR